MINLDILKALDESITKLEAEIAELKKISTMLKTKKPLPSFTKGGVDNIKTDSLYPESIAVVNPPCEDPFNDTIPQNRFPNINKALKDLNLSVKASFCRHPIHLRNYVEEGRAYNCLQCGQYIIKPIK